MWEKFNYHECPFALDVFIQNYEFCVDKDKIYATGPQLRVGKWLSWPYILQIFMLIYIWPSWCYQLSSNCLVKFLEVPLFLRVKESISIPVTRCSIKLQTNPKQSLHIYTYCISNICNTCVHVYIYILLHWI